MAMVLLLLLQGATSGQRWMAKGSLCILWSSRSFEHQRCAKKEHTTLLDYIK